MHEDIIKGIIAKKDLRSLGQYNMDYPLISASKIRDIESQLNNREHEEEIKKREQEQDGEEEEDDE